MADAPAQARPGTEDQVTGLAADQLSAVPAFEAAPVPEAATPASEPVTFDYSTVEGIRAATEGNPALRNYLEKQRLDTANAERQRLQREWDQSEGSIERAQQTVKSIVDRLDMGEDPDTISRELPHYVTANANVARAEVLRSLVEQAIANASPETQSLLLADLEEAGNSPAGIEKVTARALTALTEKVKTDTLTGLTEEDLGAHPTVKDYIARKVAEELEIEMTAQRTEARIRSGAPATPTGVAPATDGDLVESIVNMPEAERMAYMLDLATNNPEEFARVEQMLMAAAG